MYRLKLLSIILLLSISCGREDGEQDNTINGYEPLNANDAKELTKEQLASAKRICASLTYKRLIVLNDLVGKNKSVNFKLFKKSCFENEEDVGELRAYITSPLNTSNPLRYKPLNDLDSDNEFLLDVVSEKSEIIKGFCQAIKGDKKPLDLIQNDTVFYKYMFPINTEGVLEIITYTKDSNSTKFFPARADRLEVVLTKGEDKGFLKSRMTGAFCSQDRNVLTYLRQSTDFL